MQLNIPTLNKTQFSSALASLCQAKMGLHIPVIKSLMAFTWEYMIFLVAQYYSLYLSLFFCKFGNPTTAIGTFRLGVLFRWHCPVYRSTCSLSGFLSKLSSCLARWGDWTVNEILRLSFAVVKIIIPFTKLQADSETGFRYEKLNDYQNNWLKAKYF